MDEAISHIELNVLESRISRVEPETWHSHGINTAFARLYYVKKGRGFFSSRGKEHELIPETLYLIPPRGDFSYGCSEHIEIWWIHFTATMRGIISIFDYLPYATEFKPDDIVRAEERMLRLVETANHETPADQLECRGILFETISTFFRVRTKSMPLADKATLDRFEPVIDWINNNPGTKICITELAELACYERSHFTTLFTKLFGVPPARFITRQRIELAQLMLKTGNPPLEEVARDLGFSDAFHLSKTFKRYTGMSPRDFRKSERRFASD